MKGAKRFAILRAIGGAAVHATDLLEAFLSAGYGASVRKIERELTKKEEARRRQGKLSAERQCFYDLLYHLKRDGLIEEHVNSGTKLFLLTARGKAALAQFRENLRRRLPSPVYKKETSPTVIVVTFDIPERERRKRNWLRVALTNLDFTMVQKSVWLGTTKLPKGFLEHLADLRLIPFIHIFTITKAGSLQSLLR